MEEEGLASADQWVDAVWKSSGIEVSVTAVCHSSI